MDDVERNGARAFEPISRPLEAFARAPAPVSLATALAVGIALGMGAAPRMWAATAPLFGVGLFLAVERARREGALARAAGIGLVGGIGFGLSAYPWVEVSLIRFAEASLAFARSVTALTIVVEAIPVAVACAGYVVVARVAPSAMRFCASLALAFSWIATPFTWRPIGMALDVRLVAGLIGLGGAGLGEFLVLLPACQLVERRITPRRLGAIAATILVVVVLGSTRLLSIDEATRRSPTLRIGVIQPNVSLAVGLDRSRRASRLAWLREATAREARRGVSLVLWPESAHPYVLPRERTLDLPAPHDTRANELPVGVVAGVMTEASRCRRWNGVIAFGRDGRIVGRVDKQRRFPFADFVPLAELVSERVRCRGLEPSEDVGPIRAASSLGALVCYDELFRGPAFERARGSAKYLASFTNDAWYEGTREPYFQEQVARLRAVETGLDLVRSANTGLSSHIGPDGRFVARLGVRTRGHLEASVRLRDRPAPAVHLAEVVDLVFFAALAVAYVAQRRGKSSSGGGR